CLQRLLPAFPTRRSSDLMTQRANMSLLRMAAGRLGLTEMLAPEALEGCFHDAVGREAQLPHDDVAGCGGSEVVESDHDTVRAGRSEEHTSELQSRENLVC